MAARATLSRGVVPSDSYPPKFMEAATFNTYRWELYHQWQDGILDGFEMRKQLDSWRVVGSAAQIIQTICGWVGLSYQLRTSLSNCALTYIPVDKPVIAAVREIASWSGASVMLDRNGVLQIFDWEEAFARGWEPAQPAHHHRVRGALRALHHQPRERGGEHLLRAYRAAIAGSDLSARGDRVPGPGAGREDRL